MVARVRVALVLMVALALVNCAGSQVQQSWNALSPGDKARVVLDGMQTELNTKFDQAKAYVMVNPQYQDTWKTKIVPAFDTTNRAIASSVILAKQEKLTPDQVYSQLQPMINNIINMLIQIGAVKTK